MNRYEFNIDYPCDPAVEDAERLQALAEKYEAIMKDSVMWVQEGIDNTESNSASLACLFFSCAPESRDEYLRKIGLEVVRAAEKYIEWRAMQLAEEGEEP